MTTPPPPGGAPAVAVWRTRWLPRSETFVRDHVESLQRYRPLTFGLHRLPDGLDIVPDRAPFPFTPLGRRLEALSRRTGYRGLHDRWLARQAPRLVHAHFGTDAVTALPIMQRNDLPFAVTFHGYDVQKAPTAMPGSVYADHLPALFERADILLPVSDFLAGELLALGAPREKLHVHHLGIRTDRPAPDPGRAREGIVYVGRLVEQKGVVDLLEAVALLPGDLRRTPISIIGGGPLEGRLRERGAELGLDVRMIGWQTPDQVADWFAGARMFVGPSRPGPTGGAEAFGLVFLEAALAATPTVSYRAGGLPDAVADGETGILVPVDDLQALADAIEGLLTDPAGARAMGEAGRARVLRDFDIHTRTAALEQVYDGLTH